MSPTPKAPVVVLVEPQLGENIGAAARAMANFGLSELRLVAPRDGWPNEKAIASASRADHVIDKARVFDTTAEAVADLTAVLATTARSRELTKPVIGPAEAAERMIGTGEAEKAGVLFGRERSGLSNEDVALADTILTLPVEPTFSSLNIAQAVLVIAYEWRKRALGEALPFGTSEGTPPATKEEVFGLFHHLKNALDEAGYFQPQEMRPVMARNLLGILQKGAFSAQDVRTLRGVVAHLEGRRGKKRVEET
ncbi:MAG: RNA methyltransferase [Pseudomonadota bacterium]